RDDLPAATQHLLTGKELGERSGFPPNRTRWCVAMARIREAGGDLDGALDLLDEAERMYVPDFSPNVRPVAAVKARVWVAHGRLGEAQERRGTSAAEKVILRDELERPPGILLRLGQMAQNQGKAGAPDRDRTGQPAKL